jgi:hypothetical protein
MPRPTSTKHARAAALVLLVVPALQCGHADTSRAELDAFPEARAMLAGAAPAEVTDRGARLVGPARGWVGSSVVADVARSALEPTRISLPEHPDAVRYTRLGAQAGRTEITGGSVHVRGASKGVDAVVFARPGEIEELLVVHDASAELGYRIALEPGWALRPLDHGASILDASGEPRLALHAAKAWDAEGRVLDVRTDVSGDEIRFAVDAPHTLPMVVDPGWSTAFAPIQIRRKHTATLLGDGELFVVGGSAGPSTTELHNPWKSTSEMGPATLVPRVNHTATMLLSGKVLIAGGNGTDTAEIFDPVTRTFAMTNGPMTKKRSGHSAVRLPSGKVLIAGGGGASDPSVEIFDPAAGTFSAAASRSVALGDGALVMLTDGRALFAAGDDSGAHAEIYQPSGDSWTVDPDAPPAGNPTATRLADGRVFLSELLGCQQISDVNCFGTSSVFDPTNATFASGPAMLSGRQSPAVALLPSGQVVVAGGSPSASVNYAERFDALGPATLTNDGTTAAAHTENTATLLPGGDVLVLGGAQATVSDRVNVGWLHAGPPMTFPRADHQSARLHDGRALIAGGRLGNIACAPTPCVSPAVIYDPSSGAFVSAGESVVMRVRHTMTTLPNGKVLLAGGIASGGGQSALASAELFDPAAPAGSQFKTTASMGQTRAGHAATLLASGKVLITGGCKSFPCKPGDALASAETFDPTTETFTPVAAALPAPLTAHGAVLMGNGKVLVVGGSTATIFDPLTETFQPAAPPGASRDGRTAHLLPSGKVFVAGGDTLSADLYDPASGTWSFSSSGVQPIFDAFGDNPYMEGGSWAARPDGRLVSSRGVVVFDPLTKAAGTFQANGAAAPVPPSASSVLLGSGEVLVSGGDPCISECFSVPQASTRLYDDGSAAANRPTITEVAAKVTPGTHVTVKGTGFASSAPEASSGRTSASPANHPFITWVSDHGDAVVAGTVLDFTDTTATWVVPATALYGHGQLFVSVSGVVGKGAPVEIAAAPQAVGCANDAQCGSGFCVDGVCCDRRCDGICEACSAAKKGSGDDGVCGAVPPGKGTCVLSLGTACSDGKECVTGLCSQGVCCDSTCTGDCQSCNQPAHLGICSAVNEGSCGAACDGDHTLKKVGAPDVDCTPYACAAQSCKMACASVKDCVAPFVCSLDGLCVMTPPAPKFDDSACGCRLVGRARSASDGDGEGAGLVLAGLALALSAIRRRRA